MRINSSLFPLIAAASLFYACSDSSSPAATDDGIAETTTATTYICADGTETENAAECQASGGVADSTTTTVYICSDGTRTTNADNCSEAATGNSSNSTAGTSSTTFDPSSSQEVIEQPATEGVTYQEAEGDIKLTFSASGLAVENDNGSCVTVEGNVATIKCAGNYNLTGNSSDFQVVVAASTEAKVYLYLNGLDLTSASDAPIYAQSADKVFLMLVDGTDNKLADASNRTKKWTYTKNGTAKEDTTGAVIYAKDDITFKGNGSLTLTANYNNGIQTSNDVKFKDVPTIKVTAKNNAIKGKGSVKIEGGYYTLTTSEGDAIKSDEDDAEDLANGKGYVEILGGEFTIKAADKGVKANNYILLSDSVSTPVMNITAGTGTPDLSKSEGGMGGPGSFGGRPGQFGYSSSSSDDSSPKGFKADSNVYLHAGKITVNAEGNCVDGKKVFVTNGSYTLSGRRGLQAADTLKVSGGTVTTLNSYEGLESIVIHMTGGITYTYATDDGWNATDKSASDNCTNCVVNVSGGFHFVRVGSGDTDGIDSNGKIYVSGGYVGVENMSSNGGTANVFDCGSCGGGGFGGGMGPGQSSSTNSGEFLTGGNVVGFAGATELGTLYSVSYSSSNYYGTSNWACKPKGSGSKILSLQANPSSVDVNGMTAIDFGTTEASCYYKK